MSHKIYGAREQLLTEANKMLIEVGFERLNIRTLVKRCDIATGTFYSNFSCKEELVVEILKSEWEQILSSINTISAIPIPFKEKMERIYALVHDFFHNYKNIFLEMLVNSTSGQNSNFEIKQTFCSKMSGMLKDEIACGELRTNLNINKLSYIILQNFIYMSKEEYITFDDFYQFLNPGQQKQAEAKI